MAYVAPSTVTTLQTYTSAAHNIIVNDIIDHETRIGTAGLTWISTTTITGSNASPQTITNCFSATYDNYRLVFKGLTCTTASNALLVRLGTNVSTANYTWTKSGITTAGAANNSGSFGDTSWTGQFISSTVPGSTLTCDIISPFLTDYTYWNGSGFGAYSTAGVYFGHQLSGAYLATTSFTAFTLLAQSAGTLGGSVSVYGYHI